MGPSPQSVAKPPAGLPRHKPPPGWRVELFVHLPTDPILTISDTKRGMPYYVNPKTNQSQWTPPSSPARSREATPDREPITAGEHHQSPASQNQEQKQSYAEYVNNAWAGARDGFNAGRHGTPRHGLDSNSEDQYIGGGGGFGRRRRGGLIHGIIGGIMGLLEGNKYPEQQIQGGGRKPQSGQPGGSPSPAPPPSPAPHYQESGVHSPPAATAPAVPPPDYDPEDAH
jgi:hypothetical protein